MLRGMESCYAGGAAAGALLPMVAALVPKKDYAMLRRLAIATLLIAAAECLAGLLLMVGLLAPEGLAAWPALRIALGAQGIALGVLLGLFGACGLALDAMRGAALRAEGRAQAAEETQRQADAAARIAASLRPLREKLAAQHGEAIAARAVEIIATARGLGGHITEAEALTRARSEEQLYGRLPRHG
jgi:hypothetical protein